MISDYRILVTPQHTGTWFLISFLMDHPDFKEFFQFSSILSLVQGYEGKEHTLSSNSKEAKIKESLNEKELTLVHNHMRVLLDNSRLGGHIDIFLRFLLISNPVLITLRDPLLSVITMKQRGGSVMDTKAFISKWLVMVHELELMKDRIKVKYLPMDLLKGLVPFERINHLRGALNFIEVGDDLKNLEHSVKWVTGEKWNTDYNSCGVYEAKSKYQENDRDYFLREFPEEMEALKRIEGEIRPFLENKGYRRLLWWN